MKIFGSLGFYSYYIKNFHVDSQHFYEIIKDTTPFKWTEQHEERFKEILTRISEDTALAVPSTKYAFHIHVDSSNVWTGYILLQQFPEGKKQSHSILEFSITPSRKCQPFTVNYVE